MNFKINNDQDGFNSYISQDEFFNQGGGLGTTSLAGGYGSIPKPFFGRPRPTIKPSIPYHTHSIETGGPNRPRTLGPKPLPRPIPTANFLLIAYPKAILGVKVFTTDFFS